MLTDNHKKFRRVKSIPWQIMDGIALVLVPHKSFAHELNETATKIWELIEQETSIEIILEKICREYEVPRDQAHKDLTLCLSEMQKMGLIECL